LLIFFAIDDETVTKERLRQNSNVCFHGETNTETNEKRKETGRSLLNRSGRIECWSLGSDSPSFAWAILDLPKLQQTSSLSFGLL